MVLNCSLFFISNFFKKYFLNGNHKWPTLCVKSGFFVQVEIKKLLLKLLSNRTDQMTIPLNKLPCLYFSPKLIQTMD